MKILHLSAIHDWGGGGLHIENLRHELSKIAPEVENIIMVAAGGEFHSRLADQKIAHATLPLGFNLDPRAVRKIISICKKNKYDLIHLHGATSLALAVIADHFYDLPPFIFSKKTSFPIQSRKRTLYKYNHPKLKKILCVSEATKNRLSGLERPERFEVVYHGTRTDNKSQKSPFSLRSKLQLPEETTLIGNIANHMPAKDLMTFVKAAHFLVSEKKRTDVHFVQIGKFDRDSTKVFQLVQQLKMQKFITFLDFMPEASNFIPQLDAMLITSEYEGVPQVIYESFFHEVPVVSTCAGGIPEVITHKENGLLADVGDYKGLAENLLFLIESRQLIPTFAKISKARLLEKFTSEIMAKKTLEVYKKVLHEKF